MPIARIADRARLPRLGKIRLGIKATTADGKEYPKEVHYFVLPPELRAKYGDTPTRLPVLFPSNDVDAVLPMRYERWARSLLTLACDGTTAVDIPKRGPEVVGPCKREAGAATCVCEAKAMARLNVIVLGGPIGVYQVLVGGEQRIGDLHRELSIFASIFGGLQMVNGHPIPFEVVREEAQATIRNTQDERIVRQGWPVHVRCTFTVEDALAARGLPLLAAGAPVALAGAGTPALPPRTDAEAPAEPAEDMAPGVSLSPREESLELLFDLFLAVSGMRPAPATALMRRTVRQHLGRDVESLDDLDDAEVAQITRVMRDTNEQARRG